MTTLIVFIVIITGVCFLMVSLNIASGNSDRAARKAFFDESIKEGQINLPKCDYAYECYLNVFIDRDELPDCTKCKLLNKSNNASQFDA